MQTFPGFICNSNAAETTTRERGTTEPIHSVYVYVYVYVYIYIYEYSISRWKDKFQFAPVRREICAVERIVFHPVFTGIFHGDAPLKRGRELSFGEIFIRLVRGIGG